MKKSLLLCMLLAALLVAGCQTAAPGGAQATNTPAAPVSPVYPGPEDFYPGPESAYPGIVSADDQGAGLYPWYDTGMEVPWSQAVGMIMNGEVSQVAQAHDLTVQLTLKDGRTLTAIEPSIDEVMRVIEACGAPCQDILVATE